MAPRHARCRGDLCLLVTPAAMVLSAFFFAAAAPARAADGPPRQHPGNGSGRTEELNQQQLDAIRAREGDARPPFAMMGAPLMQQSVASTLTRQ